MTGQEVAFLLLGILVGGGLGAALATVLKRRTEPKLDVRVTVAPNAIPRRGSTTLAYAGSMAPSLPARGGPADPWPDLRADAPAPPKARTPVRSVRPPFVLATAPAGGGGSGRLVPVPMGSMTLKHDPPKASHASTASEPTALDGAGVAIGTAVLERLPPSASPAERPSASAAAASEPEAQSRDSPAPSGPCAEFRTVADERCQVAARARVEAERAQDTLRAAQRSYDEHHATAEQAQRAADPRTIREAKDDAQRAFRAARSGAAGKEAIDAAARDWLLEINRINQEAKAAAVTAAREQESARNLASSLDRLTVEADAARIAAESADEACLNARQAAADCEETLVAEPAAQPAMPSGAPSETWTAEASSTSALGTGTAPTIFRLLEGDRVALAAVVERLAGQDPAERRASQIAITNLVDAVLATAIEGAALQFPEDDPFWGPFTMSQSRDIVSALSSLGYRFDGLGGWVDGRVPSQRDLALALGYAGLDPMRMRHWPNETEMAGLFANVRVAAAEYLAVSAGDLTLGELVTMLGPRADALTDVWNAWGRIRPLLLEER